MGDGEFSVGAGSPLSGWGGRSQRAPVDVLSCQRGWQLGNQGSAVTQINTDVPSVMILGNPSHPSSHSRQTSSLCIPPGVAQGV